MHCYASHIIHMGLLIVYLTLAIFVSFLCSILEAVLLSVTPSYIEALKEAGKLDLKKRLEVYKNDIDKPLAAILSFNTIAHTVGAAGVGAQAAKIFGDAYLGATSAILTLLILVLSEIIPKTLGATYWRSLAGFTVKTLSILIWLMYPLVILSKGITRILSRKVKEGSFSREEVSAMADIGEREGIFHATESRMLKSMLRFRKVHVEGVMTPRTVMVMVEENLTISDLFNLPDFDKVTRIPVYKNHRDDITGYVHKHEVLTMLAKDKHTLKLKEIRRPILILDKKMRVFEVLDQFIKSKENIALATDRYGTVSGLVTMEDIMETILGIEIMDEFDSVEDMQLFARSQWEKRARALGILKADEDNPEKSEARNVVKFGTTGGHPGKEDTPKPDK